ncbi:MAG: hypothetical protein JWQ35_1798, partial [Bacteriovoracaceae bacterium]|nr:hypothetical protein [Bacteriovoracaceae bacterium]
MKLLIALALIGVSNVAAQSEPPLSLSIADGEQHQLTSSPIQEKLQLNEVTMGANAILLLPPFKSVTIQKLVAKDGARIRLAHLSSGADGATKGQDGGNSRFFFDQVSGHILIESRGGSGVDGLNGKNGLQGANGNNGRNARTLIFGLFYLGNGEDGQLGANGLPGEFGGDGGDGGAGGNITVYYREKIDFAEVIVDVDGDAHRGEE